MIKLIIFDFDGVIEDNYELHYLLSAKEFAGLTREEHKAMFDSNIFSGLDKLQDRNTGFDFVKNFQSNRLTAKTKPSVRKTLISLSKKYKLGIISSAREEGLKVYLQNNSLGKIFSFVYGKETDPSKTEKFYLIMRDFGIKKEEIAFVTDTLGDVIEAKKAGLKYIIGVDFGYHDRERLRRGEPYRIVSSFDEIEKLISDIK